MLTATTRQTVETLLKRHALGLGVAVLLAGLLVLPRWWVMATEPSEGVRIQLNPWGAGTVGYDETLYLTQIRSAYVGDVPIHNAYLSDGSSAPRQLTSLWQHVIGISGHVLGGPFLALALFSTLAALAAMVLLYALGVATTGSRFAAALLPAIILVALQFILRAGGFLPLRHWSILEPLLRIDALNEVHIWSRFPAPLMILAPVLGLTLLLPAAVEGRSRWASGGCAVMLALLVWSYFYAWTAIAVALVGWGCWLALKREWAMIGRLALIGIGAVLLASPELYGLASTARTLAPEFSYRVGVGDNPGLDPINAVVLQRLLVGLPFLAVLMFSRPERDRLYVALFLAPLVLAVTQDIVPQPWHYNTQVWTIFALPAFLAGGAGLVKMLADRIPIAPARAALAVIAIVSVGYLAVFQWRAVAEHDTYVVSREEKSALDWISENVPSEKTVVSPSIGTNLLIAAMTPASTYLDEGAYSRIPDEEMVDRVLRVQAAFGYSETDVFHRLTLDRPDGGFNDFDVIGDAEQVQRELEEHLAYFTFHYGVSFPARITTREPGWRSRYQQLLRTPRVLTAHPADYLYCGPRERFYTATSPAPETLVRIAFQQGDVLIYEIVNGAAANTQPFTGCGTARR